jgi:hypothetical protein
LKPPALNAEFLLLARCCQWNFARLPEIERPAIPENVQWDLVVRLARRHRVQGLVWNALAKAEGMPAKTREALSSDARSIAATNLAIAGECTALLRAFEEARVPLLFIKGLSVGALAYRSPLLKMGWDIDLLVDPEDLEQASSLLTGLGYVLRLPAATGGLSAWHGHSKESVWERDDCFHVELHTRLADNPRLIPTIDVHSPRQWIEVAPALSLPTLSEMELLAYLAVHGASSAWFRLKWISDFAALLAGRNGDELDWLYHRCQQLGAARATGQALLLADRLFGLLDGCPRLRQQLASDPAMLLLCRAAMRLMAGNVGEPTERHLGTLPIHWTQLLLQPGLAFKFSELWRQARLLMTSQ